MSYRDGTIRMMMSAPRQVIYGVAWDKSSDPALTRTDSAIGMVANIGLDGSTPQNDFDNADIYGEITDVTDGFGNEFVRIPKFYIRKTDSVGYKTWQVSKYSLAGGYLPKCFWDFTGGTELDYVDIGKYIATVDGSNRMESKQNLYPKDKTSLPTFRVRAQNNGAGYHVLDVHTYDVIRTLCYIEFATLDVQSIMYGFGYGANNAAHTAQITEAGANRVIIANAVAAQYEVGQAISCGTSVGGHQVFFGRTITGITAYDASNMALGFDGASADITAGNIVYNTPWRNGWSSVMLASSGSIGSNSSGKFPCQYRGIESPWANMWMFVDGVNFSDLEIWVCENAENYASDTFAPPYYRISYDQLSATSLVPADMGYDPNYPFLEMPIVDGGSDYSTYYGDSYHHGSGSCIAVCGGSLYKRLEDGLANWHNNNPSGVTSHYFGSRLIRKAT